MADDLDVFVQRLQSDIFEETRREWGEKAYQRWRDPRHLGAMDDADGRASLRGTCGDQMQIYLKVDAHRVTRASFLTDGCGPSVVCGSFAAEMSLGKDPEELFEISGEAILSAIGGLPKDHEHCAFLAAATLHAAANDYFVRQAKK